MACFSLKFCESIFCFHFVPGVDSKMKFTIEPLPGDDAFNQWKDAMKAVARLPLGIPPEFRKKVSISLFIYIVTYIYIYIYIYMYIYIYIFLNIYIIYI